MGFLSKLFSASVQPSGLVNISGGAHSCRFSIVGEASYKDALRRIRDKVRRDDELDPDDDIVIMVRLDREPANPYDANAIAVRALGFGEPPPLVGYFSRAQAAIYAPAFDQFLKQRGTPVCRAEVIGGTREVHQIGVCLDFAGLPKGR